MGDSSSGTSGASASTGGNTSKPAPKKKANSGHPGALAKPKAAPIAPRHRDAYAAPKAKAANPAMPAPRTGPTSIGAKYVTDSYGLAGAATVTPYSNEAKAAAVAAKPAENKVPFKPATKGGEKFTLPDAFNAAKGSALSAVPGGGFLAASIADSNRNSQPSYNQEYWADRVAEVGSEQATSEIQDVGSAKAYSGDVVVSEDQQIGSAYINEFINRNKLTPTKESSTSSGLFDETTTTSRTYEIDGQEYDITSQVYDPTIGGMGFGDKVTNTFVNGISTSQRGALADSSAYGENNQDVTGSSEGGDGGPSSASKVTEPGSGTTKTGGETKEQATLYRQAASAKALIDRGINLGGTIKTSNRGLLAPAKTAKRSLLGY
tara:strand:+ start:1930 stop:3060 length:1131 start_codon:yes stop_codon:yes gene_type:complete